MEFILISKQNININYWNGGETFEYFIYPEHTNYADKDFLFRISSATIQKVPSEFTRFSGFERFLVMLDNDLLIERNKKQEMYKVLEIFKFNSNDRIESFSSGNDFNLIISEQLTNYKIQILQEEQVSKVNFIILFAIENCEVILNNEFVIMNAQDCLVIKNFENKKIFFNSSKPMIFIDIAF